MRIIWKPWGVEAPHTFEVTEPPVPRTRVGKRLRWLRQKLYGPPLSDRHDAEQRLSKKTALAVLGADSLSSSIYGPEALLRALSLGGAAAFAWSAHLAFAVVALLAIVASSYFQAIRFFPKGGGGYVVTRDSLGRGPSLLAGSALMLDYLLNVAVSVAAGTQALTSAFEGLSGARVPLCLLFVAILAVGNLRGTRSSGLLFSAPVYLYVGACLTLIGYGLVRAATEGLPHYAAAPGDMVQASTSLGVLFVIRAFTAGAVALTGTEAVADGVTAFGAPEERNAKITLTIMALLFATMFLGIAVLAGQMQVLPDPAENQSVVSRVAATLAGRGVLFYVIQLSTALALIIAANTSFVDFPRLAHFLAGDQLLPEKFSQRGERLAFDHGILVLAAVAAVLIVGFGGSLQALLPLFTIGVFLAFTCALASVSVQWHRHRGRGWRIGRAINAAGAAVCLAIALFQAVSQLTRGAWLALILIPLFAGGLAGIRRHLSAVRAELQQPLKDVPASQWVVIPVSELDRPALTAMSYARSALSGCTRIEAVHVSSTAEEAEAFRQKWTADIPLVILQSPYRERVRPLLTYIDGLSRKARVTVLVPETVFRRWWHHLLHSGVSLLLRSALLLRPGTAVISAPYHVGGRK